MITIAGLLAIHSVLGRKGHFNVGHLSTSIGEFVVKDTLLNQHSPGNYSGDFLITDIHQTHYTSAGRLVIEVRAKLDSMVLKNTEASAEEDTEDPPIQVPGHEITPWEASTAAEMAFPVGNLLITRAVQSLIENGALNPIPYLKRHVVGDWGEICSEDWESNQWALENGERLLSCYEINAEGESRLWIITEADRSSTTMLLPSEY